MMVLFHSCVDATESEMEVVLSLGSDLRILEHLDIFEEATDEFPEAVAILHCDADRAPEILQRIRARKSSARLLVLLPRASDIEQAALQRAKVLFAGADDAQPVSIEGRELIARTRALAGRGRYIDHLHIDIPGARYDVPRGFITTDDGRQIRLSPKLGAILAALARRPGETRTKEQLFDEMYGSADGPEVKIIDVMICKLRHKLMEASGGRDAVETVWGRGYQFVPGGFDVSLRSSRRRVVR